MRERKTLLYSNDKLHEDLLDELALAVILYSLLLEDCGVDGRRWPFPSKLEGHHTISASCKKSVRSILGLRFSDFGFRDAIKWPHSFSSDSASAVKYWFCFRLRRDITQEKFLRWRELRKFVPTSRVAVRYCLWDSD